MKLKLLAVGHRQPAWVTQAVADYAKRLPRHLGFEVVELAPAVRKPGGKTPKDAKTAKSSSNAKRVSASPAQADEAERLGRQLLPAVHVVALDEHGKPMTTRSVAEALERWQQQGKDVAMLIGGADGLAPALLEQADERWSLSGLTFPHGLARVVIVEQLYRAWTLTQNHPYHRE